MALTILSSAFFIWGFLTALNSVLIPHLQQVFELTYTQSMLIQGVFFSAPLLVCLPVAKGIERFGYQHSLIMGLMLVCIGALAFYPATKAFSFALVLGAVFITALGVAALQVVANPYVAALGDPTQASSRLTLTSGINSLGTTVAPYVGAVVLFSPSDLTAQEEAALVQSPYIMVACVALIVGLLVTFIRLPAPQHSRAAVTKESVSLWQYRHLTFGVVAIFCYTGAEVSIASFLMSYLNAPELGGYDRPTAGKLIALYCGGAMIGRLVGSAVFRYINARKVLIINAIAALLLIAYSVFFPGRFGAWALILIGLCNSIMYPVIFSLALEELGDNVAKASGLLVMAGVGGGILPMVQAVVADSTGIIISLGVPAILYVVIACYGLLSQVGILNYHRCQTS